MPRRCAPRNDKICGGAIIDYLLRTYGKGRFAPAVGAPLHPRINSEISNHMGWLESELAGKSHFVGDTLTGADIQLSFVAQSVVKGFGREAYPNLARFVDMVAARPAYQRAVAKGGE